MKRILVGATLIVAGLVATTGASSVSAQNVNETKVFVCKYVTTPGSAEVLKGGKNPIFVSENAIPGNPGDAPVEVGDSFTDGQNRSFVLQIGNATTPSITDCPGSETPPIPEEVTPLQPEYTPPTCTAAGAVEVLTDPEERYTYGYVTADGVTTVSVTANQGFVLSGYDGPWMFPIAQLTGDVACPSEVASNPPATPVTPATPSAPVVPSAVPTVGSATPVVGSAGPVRAQASPAQALPATGTSSWVLAFMAMALVLVGSGFVSFSRRLS